MEFARGVAIDGEVFIAETRMVFGQVIGHGHGFLLQQFLEQLGVAGLILGQQREFFFGFVHVLVSIVFV